MSYSTFERENTFKSTVTFTSGSTYIDPVSNLAYIDVIKPDGTYLIQGESGQRVSEGIYQYYFSTSSTDPLGLYIIDWYGTFSYDTPWGNMPKHQREVVRIVKVKQE